jgi:hypothetical protein
MQGAREEALKDLRLYVIRLLFLNLVRLAKVRVQYLLPLKLMQNTNDIIITGSAPLTQPQPFFSTLF